MGVNRGDVVLVAARGDSAGKPRPAMVIQSDLFNPTHDSVTLCLVTSELRDAPLFRPDLKPTRENGLSKTSQVMVDKIFSAKRGNIGGRIGILDKESMRRVDEALKVWLQT
jgi:mRNA interferase MazF